MQSGTPGISLIDDFSTKFKEKKTKQPKTKQKKTTTGEQACRSWMRELRKTVKDVLNPWLDKYAHRMQAETPKLVLEETRSNITAQHVKARHPVAFLAKSRFK